LGTDELLLNRTEGTSGLFKVSQETLLDSVPTNPPGVVMPYVGDTEPPGWKFCDGSEYLKADYSDLFEAIGFKFGGESTVTPGFFRVPDLRGRMPLGADNMGGTSADTVQASYADFVGAEGGKEDTEIAVQNLPQHVHDLRSTDNEQFFATREDNSTPVGNEKTAGAPTSFGNAQKIPNSGGVDSADELGQPLNLMNPSLTFNYIIYMGRIL
jgi:microcystin-dependent protein